MARKKPSPDFFALSQKKESLSPKLSKADRKTVELRSHAFSFF